MPAVESSAARDQVRDASIGHPVRVLVVDDDPSIRQVLALCLRDVGCEVALASSGSAAREAALERSFDLALLDLQLGTESGLEVLPELLSLRPELEVVVVSAQTSVESAVEAMHRGARDYIPKPFTLAQIREVVERTRRRRGQAQGAPHAEGSRLAPEVGDAGRRPVAGGDFTVEEVEREHVLRVLARAPTLSEASRILGLDVTTLWRKRKRWGR